MKKILSLFSFIIPFVLILFTASCSEENVSEPPPEYVYQVPEQTNDGWVTASLDEVGIEADKLFEIADIISAGIIPEIHSILIVKDDKLVFEEYFKGHAFYYSGTNHHGQYREFNRNTVHNQASVTKSVTSALVGIAIDQGKIAGVDAKVLSFFPEYSDYDNGEKKNLSIEHLLTMSSGLDWNESEIAYGDSRNDLIHMWNEDDPLEYLISKPISFSPGTHFYYNSGLTNMLGEIIYKATSMKPDVFADHYLFGKLGITDRSWEKFNNGVVFVSGDLRIRPRDMAKFGYLYLNEGVWNGEQIISKEWIQKSVTRYISVNSVFDYGYKWWLRNFLINSNTYFAYSARGWGGQQITVIPELDLVVVFTGCNYMTSEPVDEIMVQYILPAVTENINGS